MGVVGFLHMSYGKNTYFMCTQMFIPSFLIRSISMATDAVLIKTNFLTVLSEK